MQEAFIRRASRAGDPRLSGLVGDDGKVVVGCGGLWWAVVGCLVPG